MKLIYKYSLIFIISLLITSWYTTAQEVPEDIIQINGVTMTADSLRAVPDVTVLVKHQNRGVMSSEMGVFSIVVHKGDTLNFSFTGFRSKEYVVPQDVPGQYISMIQLMVQDTFYLPETIIRPYPTKEEFELAFRNLHIPDDAYERARKNTDAYMLRALAYTMPKDGRENQAAYQNIQAQNAVYYNQRKPMMLLSPLAWGEFFEAWKRGDFRKKY